LGGYWLFGPPAPNSRSQYAAGLLPFAGTITDQTLRFENPNGNAKYRFTLTDENKLEYVLSSASESATRVFIPFWTLGAAEANRSASKTAGQRAVPAKGSPPTTAANPRPAQ